MNKAQINKLSWVGAFGLWVLRRDVIEQSFDSFRRWSWNFRKDRGISSSRSFEAFRVSLSPPTWTNDPTTVGVPYSQSFTATNEFAAVATIQTGSAFASVRSLGATIASGAAPQIYPITVPSGTTSLTVSISGASDPGADLDLYVYNCTTGTCVLAGSGTTSSASESVTISNPTATSGLG